MSFNGSGSFALVAGNPVVTGTVISSTTHNNTMSDIATNGLSNCITKDGQTTVTQNIPFNSKRLTGIAAGTALTDAARVDQIQNAGTVNVSSVAGTDTITGTLTPVPSAYADGQMFVFVPANTNTGATTINLSSLGAKSIFIGGAALTGGELVAGVPVGIRYDGTQFEVMFVGSASLSQSPTFASADAGATAGPALTLFRNSASPADDDELGEVLFDGEDDGSNQTTYAKVMAESLDVTDATEDGRLSLWAMVNGTLTRILNVAQGVWTPNATGGDKGADTINASAIYDDGVQILPLVNGTTVNVSGTSVDFTSIPSWVNLIRVSLSGVSTNGTESILLQLGDTDGVETTGYAGTHTSVSASTQSVRNPTDGFIMGNMEVAGDTMYGTLTLTHLGSNLWVASGTFADTNAPSGQVTAGAKTLTATLDRVRLTTTGGTETFDAGSMNIQYE